MKEQDLLNAFYEDIDRNCTYRVGGPNEKMSTEQYFNILPQPYRDMAFKNLRDQFPREEKFQKELDIMESSLRSAMCAFTWSDTPEGMDFWRSVARWGLAGNETLPDFP
jgi:hypothetical protein